MSSPPFGSSSICFEPYHTSSKATSYLRCFILYLCTATVHQRKFFTSGGFYVAKEGGSELINSCIAFSRKHTIPLVLLIILIHGVTPQFFHGCCKVGNKTMCSQTILSEYTMTRNDLTGARTRREKAERILRAWRNVAHMTRQKVAVRLFADYKIALLLSTSPFGCH